MEYYVLDKFFRPELGSSSEEVVLVLCDETTENREVVYVKKSEVSEDVYEVALTLVCGDKIELDKSAGVMHIDIVRVSKLYSDSFMHCS